jgi:ATP-dependent protease HslVU (ClpYQ) peptidase subunit
VTTIATDGVSMAGDGQVQDHRSVVVDDRRKVFRLEDGRIVGGAGNSADVASWVEWLAAGKSGECPVVDDAFAALILHRDGSVLWVDHKGREMPIMLPAATGSGEEIAIGAMDAGASPEEAVAIACKRDIYSGGTIIVEALSGIIKEQTNG